MRIISLVLKEPALLLIFLWLHMFTNSVASSSRRTTTASGRCPTRWPTSSSSASRWWTQPVSRTCAKNGCRSCRSTRPVSPTCSSAPRWVLGCNKKCTTSTLDIFFASARHKCNKNIQMWFPLLFQICASTLWKKLIQVSMLFFAVISADTLSAALW